MRIRLNDLSIPGQNDPTDLLMADGQFIDPAAPAPDHPAPEISLSLPGAIAFPGLINAHDHLDFNLFPPLGNTTYLNYTKWGRDIHQRNKKEIDDVLKIPLPLRIAWGIYKNLLNGFTTVVNHGEILPVEDDLITIFQRFRVLHSVGFERNWRWRLNRPGSGRLPVILHVGEGTDKSAHREINRLLRWNIFKKPLIGVHGVAMDETQANGFHALVWCPASNYFLLDKTAPIHRLKSHVPILFGTDSTLTAPWNAWEHIRMARREQMLTDNELTGSLTRQAADILGLPTGEIAPGRQADLVVSASGELFDSNPEDLLLIIHKGEIKAFDASLLTRIGAQKDFYKIAVGGREKYVKGDLPGLVREIQKFYPQLTDRTPFPLSFGRDNE